VSVVVNRYAVYICTLKSFPVRSVIWTRVLFSPVMELWIGRLFVMGWDWHLRTTTYTGLLFFPGWLQCDHGMMVSIGANS
jgi:hypothetical protein